MVTDVDEAPALSGPVTPNYAENGTDEVADYGAVDPEDDMVDWSLSGADAGLFTIDSGGVLGFVASPDFEAPRDFGRQQRL